MLDVPKEARLYTGIRDARYGLNFARVHIWYRILSNTSNHSPSFGKWSSIIPACRPGDLHLRLKAPRWPGGRGRLTVFAHFGMWRSAVCGANVR